MILVVSFLLAAALQSALWVLACRRRNAGWVDLGWSSGMAMAAITLGLAGPSHPRTWMVALLLFAWAFRLALHIYRDRLAGNRPEDSRYQALRAHWGAAADRNFLVFFLGQAALVPLFLLPPLLAASNPAPFPNWQDALGLLVIFAAVMGESISDHQLALFRANPANRGQVCRRGWWRYSRHPNYFFEWCQWWGYVVIAAGAPQAWISLLGPLLMYIFLRFLTGIPHAERQSVRSRGEAYLAYQKTTSAFFPWKPRKS